MISGRASSAATCRASCPGDTVVETMGAHPLVQPPAVLAHLRGALVFTYKPRISGGSDNLGSGEAGYLLLFSLSLDSS